MPRDAIIVLRIVNVDRAKWDALRARLKTFIQQNPDVVVDQAKYEEGGMD